MTKISIIAAISLNGAIGSEGSLPWPEPIPVDWEHLKKVTKGKKMIMGRRSYEDQHRVSSDAGNFVVTSQENYDLEPNFTKVTSLSEALEMCQTEEEVFVIGGASLFEEALQICHSLYLTTVFYVFEGDTFFPPIDRTKFKVEYSLNYTEEAETPYPLKIEKLVHLTNN